MSEQAADLFADQADASTQAQLQLQECRLRFERRVEQAMLLARNKEKRRKHYVQLRGEIGDIAAREVAKLVEGIIKGTASYPKWFIKQRYCR